MNRHYYSLAVPAAPPEEFPVHQQRKKTSKMRISEKTKRPTPRDAHPRFFAGAAVDHESLTDCVEGQKLCLHEEGSLGSRTRSVDV
jgi:hypothetical protein